MIFDPTINLGSLISMIGVFVVGVGGYFGVLRRMDKIEMEDKLAHKTIYTKLDLMWQWFKDEHAMNGKSEKEEG